MKTKMAGVATLVVLASFALTQTAAASMLSVYGSNVLGSDLTGSRTLDGGGLSILSGNVGSSNPTVTWDISWNGSTWDYLYEFSGFGSDVSHVTLDLSDLFAFADSGLIIDNEAIVTVVGGDPSDKTVEFGTLDGITGAGKIEGIPANNDDGFSISFTSTNAPMWADMFIKGGQFEVANLYYLNHFDGDSTAGYIATPDTRGVIPEPSSLLLLGFGTAAFAYRRLKHR